MTKRKDDTAAAETRRAWHALDSAEALKGLESSDKGLASEEAARRLEEHGANRLTPQAGRSLLMRFLSHFHNVLIYLLLVAAVTTALLGHWVDTGVIMGVVFINSFIGFMQEGKAERALDAIRNLLSLEAMLLRDGRKKPVPAEEIVPGDIVLLQSGDKVPADLRLIKAKNLRIDESILTGESVAVSKNTDRAPENAALGDQRSMAFSGTLVTYGQGMGVVTSTGEHTEIGRISAMLSDVEVLATPLIQKVAAFGRILAVAIIGVAAVTFAIGVFLHNFPIGGMFLAAVGLAVAAIPEGLPAIMTITLSIGVQRMAGRHAIIRRLPAVDTLGAVTTICSDKTGTLTRNEMTARSVHLPGQRFSAEGVGYAPRGRVLLDGEAVASPADHPALLALLETGLLCNDASLREDQGQWHIDGDPTEGALIVLGEKAGLDPAAMTEAHPRRDSVPFESEHRYMATLHDDGAGGTRICVKGAPERILDMCTAQGWGEDERNLDRGYWDQVLDDEARLGQRLLAVAYRKSEPDRSTLEMADVESGLTLLGVVGIIDPPRDEAITAIAECQTAGIRVKMITGDHAATAKAIGLELSIGDGEHALTGRDLDEMSDAELRKAVEETDIFARVDPEHKLRLVRAVQANGHVVAMTGDGVNDAPALKSADVGVAMGRRGTEVSKEASDMVLTDDNFASIAHAVEEGRTVYDNLRKAILFILPVSGGEALTIIAAVLLGWEDMPITPVQILWVNMVCSITLGIALAFEPPEKDVMQRPPRHPKANLLTGHFLWRISFVSALLCAGTFGVFQWAVAKGVDIEVARTAAVNTLVFFEVFYLFGVRHIHTSVINFEGIFGNRVILAATLTIIIAQLMYTYVPLSHTLFGTAPLAPAFWAVIIPVAALVFIVIEIEKVIMARIRGIKTA